jgi:hypothetical protein
VQVGHLTGEKLDVGAADADTFDVDNDMTRDGDGWRDVFDCSDSWGADHHGSHVSSAYGVERRVE